MAFSNFKKKGKEIDSVEKEALMGVANKFKASNSPFADKMKGLKKVTVASNSESGLKEGIDKAKEIVTNKLPEMEGDDMFGKDELESDSEEKVEATEIVDEVKALAENLDSMGEEELKAKIKEIAAKA